MSPGFRLTIRLVVTAVSALNPSIGVLNATPRMDSVAAQAQAQRHERQTIERHDRASKSGDNRTAPVEVRSPIAGSD